MHDIPQKDIVAFAFVAYFATISKKLWLNLLSSEEIIKGLENHQFFTSSSLDNV